MSRVARGTAGRLKAAIAAGILLASATGSGAQQQAGSDGVRPPLGFQLFCLRQPEQCRSGQSRPVRIDRALIETLLRVNHSVNTSIRPRADSASDEWSIGSRWGDCEDYVLAKRGQLIKLGVPAASLRIARVTTHKGEAHAVLVVRSDRGDLALDNLTGRILPLADTGHRLVSMSGADPMNWI